MASCGENESGLKHVLEQMRIEYGSKKASLQLLVDLYKDLSEIASMAGDLDGSIQYKQKALEIEAQTAHNSGDKII